MTGPSVDTEGASSAVWAVAAPANTCMVAWFVTGWEVKSIFGLRPRRVITLCVSLHWSPGFRAIYGVLAGGIFGWLASPFVLGIKLCCWFTAGREVVSIFG